MCRWVITLRVYPSDNGFASGQPPWSLVSSGNNSCGARKLRPTHIAKCPSSLLYPFEEKGYASSVSVNPLSTISHLSDPWTDAGGARAISQLEILARIMNKLNSESPNDEPKRPCDVFSMIGGTGTGG